MPFGAVPCTFTDIKDQSVGYRIFTLPLPDRIYSQWTESHKYYPYVYVSDFFSHPMLIRSYPRVRDVHSDSAIV